MATAHERSSEPAEDEDRDSSCQQRQQRSVAS